ncbi:MAG TPA: fatty acid desaturase CarF family protein [Aquihabitans sp.]|jgi:ubiquitin-conjugating enzyme E2 variant|nr:fatty acid desaturase CarF family protein [Aquihabitans sp.]
MTSPAAELPPRRLLGRYGYPTSHRLIEIASVLAFTILASVLARRVVAALAERADPATAVLVAAAVVAALVVADLLSGVVHAICDNLGSIDTPVVGRKFIRSFREHHTDPLDMTRGDLIRVNADNSLVCLPVLVSTLVWLDVGSHPVAASFLLALTGFVVVTNQIHKWAHMAEVPTVVRWLQRRRLVLSPEHHRVHHTPPYASHYCITSGITNDVLGRIGFWPFLLEGCRRLGHVLPGSPAAGASQGPGA